MAPRGARTRRASRSAATGCTRCSKNHIIQTWSNDWSSKGSASASACSNVALTPACARCARAKSSCRVSISTPVRSIPGNSSPSTARTAPTPQPISSSRVPGSSVVPSGIRSWRQCSACATRRSCSGVAYPCTYSGTKSEAYGDHDRYLIYTSCQYFAVRSLSHSERMVQANGVDLCTQAFGDPAEPPILLVMGTGASMLWWEDGFCRMLADRGRYVIRYDHRDTGRSTTYEPGRPGYTGTDLCDDASGVLEAYAIG